ncbi:MAG: hypothetical protein ACUVWP_08765 [bacterium]
MRKIKLVSSISIILICLIGISVYIYSSIHKKEINKHCIERQIKERKAKFYDSLEESKIKPRKAMFWEEYEYEEAEEGEVPFVSEGMHTK